MRVSAVTQIVPIRDGEAERRLSIEEVSRLASPAVLGMVADMIEVNRWGGSYDELVALIDTLTEE